MRSFYDYDLGNSTRAVLTVSGEAGAGLLRMNLKGRYTLYAGYADNATVPACYRPVMAGNGSCRIYNDTGLAWQDFLIRGRYTFWTIFQDGDWLNDDVYVLYSEVPLYDCIAEDSIMVAYRDNEPVKHMTAKEWEEGYRHGL